jgi:hypothetical protein
MVRFAVIVAALALLALLPASAGAQAGTSPTLTGEFLLCAETSTPPPFLLVNERFCPTSDEPIFSEVRCDPDGGGFSYEANGSAVGPYTGTFTETGTVRFGPHPGGPFETALRPVLEVTATFRITSDLGEVSGAKRLTQPVAASNQTYAHCSSEPTGPTGAAAIVLNAPLCYAARLPNGGLDTGTSRLAVGRQLASDPNSGALFFDQFGEQFVSDPSVTCPVEIPECKKVKDHKKDPSKDRCKGGKEK